MKILAIDTSGSNCSVAVLEEDIASSVRHGKVIANFNINIGKTHSETLLPLVDELSKFSNIRLDDIDVFACCIGPGSFTGIRIGIATIKGFALSLNKPVISVSTLEGLAYNIPTFDGLICSLLDARNNNVYAASYRLNNTPKMVGDYLTDTIDDLIKELQKHNEKVLFVGDGAISYQEKLINELKENALFTPYHLNEQSAVSIAKAAFDKYLKNEVENVDELHPLYLRKSQAERMYVEAHNVHHDK